MLYTGRVKYYANIKTKDMKTLFTKEEEEKFIELTDFDLFGETYEEFINAEDVTFETFYVNYQEKHLLKFGKYLEIE
jgi:hypothetical protein